MASYNTTISWEQTSYFTLDCYWESLYQDFLLVLYRQGDQLLEINDVKLEGLTVEKVYSILDKVPPGKVYIKVLQSNVSEKIPVELNDALSKLQIEHHLLDKKMSGKSRSVGTASTLSGASGSSDSSGRCFQFSGQRRNNCTFILFHVKCWHPN